MSRCTGHCCRNFPLPASLEEIQRRRNKDVCPPNEIWIHDGDILADMLIPLESGGTYEDGRPQWRYTCRHYDTASGDCKIYETRPWMCRDYPYGKPCEIEGCTAENRGLGALVQITKREAVG